MGRCINLDIYNSDSYAFFIFKNYIFLLFKLDYFFVQHLSAFVLDSLETSHPIKVDVNDPDEISSLFDEISYDKVTF